MGLKEYDVVDPHTGRETTLQLSDEDAKLQGLKPSDAKTAPAAKAKEPAANKQAAPPQNKGGSAAANKADG